MRTTQETATIVASLLAVSLFAAEAPGSKVAIPEGGGIVYGGELGVGVSAPEGWVFDSESGVHQGLDVVMYPTGSSWAKSTEIMYVNVVQSEEGESLSAFIQGDLARQRVNSPDLVDEAADPISLVGGAKAEVRHLRGDAWGNHEAVAYVAQGRGVAIFVLSCRSAEGFRRSLPAFRAMVKSSFLVAMEFRE